MARKAFLVLRKLLKYRLGSMLRRTGASRLPAGLPIHEACRENGSFMAAQPPARSRLQVGADGAAIGSKQTANFQTPLGEEVRRLVNTQQAPGKARTPGKQARDLAHSQLTRRLAALGSG